MFNIVLDSYLRRQRVLIHFAQRLNLAGDYACARKNRLLQEDANSLGALSIQLPQARS